MQLQVASLQEKHVNLRKALEDKDKAHESQISQLN
jgi:hypothetical protein